MFLSIFDSRLDSVLDDVSITPTYPGVEFTNIASFNTAPNRFRVSDWNQDGYPDILVTVKLTNGTN